MNATMIGLLTETPLHPGASESAGAIDLPVQRERATGYPVMVASSLKGALRNYAESHWDDEHLNQVFGNPDGVAQIGISDARLLLLPVRSLHNAFTWITCSYLLERLQRDWILSGYQASWSIPPVAPGHVLMASPPAEPAIFLEEFSYVVDTSPSVSAMGQDLARLMAHDSARARLTQQLAILSDEDFRYFAQYGLPVNARNQLDDNKISRNLWYEEQLPPDTLLYYLLLSANPSPGLDALVELIMSAPYVQLGGNESIGQGICIQSPWRKADVS